ncbi:MAG: acetyl-CoA C-acetyltransferase [Syntrophaceae bacterium]
MSDVVIVSGARTAVGEFGGSLKGVSVVELGRLVIREAIIRAGLRPITPSDIKGFRPAVFGNFEMTELQKKHYDYDSSLTPVYFDEVVMGNVLNAGLGQNPPRQSAIYAGLPEETNVFTVQKVCASGMRAIISAAQIIKAGDADIMVAGGMENMSNVPMALPDARWGYRMNMPFGKVTDLMVHDGLWEIFNAYHMGFTAENIAEKMKISKEDQDKLAYESHRRAREANASGAVANEIVPVVVPQRKGDPKVFKVDERPMETSLEKMAKLAPVFKKGGTVTAGNASGINDGAAAVVVMSAAKAKELGCKPMVKIVGYASGGVDPAFMGLGPIPAVKKILNKFNLKVNDIDLWELNEAFAVQALGCVRELNIDMAKCNINGSGISIGHPIGCTGARITYTLANQMKKRNAKLGIAGLCIGGGQGMAILLESV